MRRAALLCLPLLLVAGCGATEEEPSAAERAAQLSEAIGTTAPAPTTTSVTPTTPSGFSYEELAALDGQSCTTPGEVAELSAATASYLPAPTVSASRVCAGDGAWARLAASLDQCFATDTQRYADTGGTVLSCVSNQLWVPGQANTGPLGVNTYEVGTGTGQVVPGTYVATDVQSCYWERLDAAGEIIDNNFIDGAPRAEFTVSSSDYGLNIDGCAGWTLQA